MPVREDSGNLWDWWGLGHWVAVTTNGYVRNDGHAVMGRGCALEARQKFPEFPKEFGRALLTFGNRLFRFESYRIITFPVKYNWWERADLGLIRDSCLQLESLLNDKVNAPPVVYLPRPGCGNGQLDWLTEVKPVIQDLLSDRVVVIDRK